MSRMGPTPSRWSGVRPAAQRLAATFTDRDAERRAVTPWRKWYGTAKWQRLRMQILERDLFTCRMCQRVVPDSAQLVADHRTPHRGSAALFWDPENLWCLCARCHNSAKQAEERAAR